MIKDFFYIFKNFSNIAPLKKKKKPPLAPPKEGDLNVISHDVVAPLLPD
jgi:hypothetical protein